MIFDIESKYHMFYLKDQHHRFSTVYNAMKSVEGFREYEVISDTPSGKNSTIVLKYKLN